MYLIFKLAAFDILALVAFGSGFAFLDLLLQLHDHVGEVPDFVLLLDHLVVDLGLLQGLRPFHAGLHPPHQVVILSLELLYISLQLLGVLQQVFVLLSDLHGVLTVLQLLHHIVVFVLQLTVLFVHHGHPVVFIHVVVGHRTGLQLSVVMRKRLILFEQLMVAVFPHSRSLLLD